MNEGYYIEHNGDCWQSVFPSKEAEQSSNHETLNDAMEYMTGECHIPRNKIIVVPDVY